MRITDIRFSSAPPELERTGLCGWIALTLDGRIRVDGLTLRRTATGRLTLSFPARRDDAGRQHPYVRPLDDEARRDVEEQVLHALGFDGQQRR